jgi:hypothetical protein
VRLHAAAQRSLLLAVFYSAESAKFFQLAKGCGPKDFLLSCIAKFVERVLRRVSTQFAKKNY